MWLCVQIRVLTYKHTETGKEPYVKYVKWLGYYLSFHGQCLFSFLSYHWS